MTTNSELKDDLPPVVVIESIPVGGKQRISDDEIAREAVPVPAHLVLYPELGRGGMGRIHAATDRNLLRHVALKRLDRELSQVPMYRDGFIAEAQMTGQLEHPNIVPVHELAIDPKTKVPYFTMKLVQGQSLDAWLRDPGRAPGTTERLEDGLEIFLKVCDALAYAHHRGVIHRDIKPENIMVADFGQIYLMDWGLARLTKKRPASGDRAQMEAPGPVGTPQYMSPEQARGVPHEMDERCDVFGMGALLYELIAGRPPYNDDHDFNAIIERAKTGNWVPLEMTTKWIGVSQRLLRIVEKALAPLPKDRYQSIQELQTAVKAFLRGGLHLPRKVFGKGQLIIREGDVGDSAYMILSGTCRVFRTVGGQQETLGTSAAGDVFGEMALLLDEPRAASVEAIDDTVVLVLGKDLMQEGLGLDGWTGALVNALAQRFKKLEQTVRSSGLKRG
jgi:serine/threonine-protein kinase